MGDTAALLFQIAQSDNVATALADIAIGKVRITGDSSLREIVTLEPINKGHKVALSAIRQGELIIKYGVSIGAATKPIFPGEWVHLHNCESLYDTRSSGLDLKTGAPHDTKYE